MLQYIYGIRKKDPGIGGMKLWYMYRKAFGSNSPVGRDRFEDIVDKYGLKVRTRVRKPRTTDSTHGLPVYPNLISDFIPDAPNRLWVSDITYITIWLNEYALANENGGYLVFGVRESSPHKICGSVAWEGLEGKLVQDIYRDLKIRVQTEVLFENGKRVLILKIPSRPIGKPLYFEDVALMRVGESLTRMSDEMYLSIIQGQEPDFSAKICEGLSLSDLNDTALAKMKRMYADRQSNEAFLQISDEQMISDLKLSINGKLTFAALILLGKAEKIDQYLPQSRIVWEFRNTETQIHYDRREVVEAPFLLGIDTAWELVDQPTLNLNHPLQLGPYIYNIYDFNESVVRGERYVIKEIEHLLKSLQGNAKKIGTLKNDTSHSLNLNQLKYLIDKLVEDKILKAEGINKGRTYSIEKEYEILRDDLLITTILNKLKEQYG